MGAGDNVRAEAARLRVRLAVAADRLDAVTAGRGDDNDDDVDPQLRALLHPCADRVSRLLTLAGSLADGAVTDSAIAEAARAIADEQPFRRPR